MLALFVCSPERLQACEADKALQSLVVRKSVEQTFEIKMVAAPLSKVFLHADELPVVATQAIANVVKSSFGPSGLDKMMVDDIGVCCTKL